MHPEDLQRKIDCTRRKIARLQVRGRGASRDCQRLQELLERLLEQQEETA